MADYTETKVDIRDIIKDVRAGRPAKTPRGRVVSRRKVKTPQPRREQTLWERFKDDFTDAASRSMVGAGVRKVADWTDWMKPEGMSEEEHDAAIAQAERNRRADYEVRRANDPALRRGDILGSAARGATSLGATILGGADPTYLIAPGGSAAARFAASKGVGQAGQRAAAAGARVASQAGIQGLTDAGTQGYEMLEGVRDDFDPVQAGVATLGGGVFQGLGEAAGAGLRRLRSRGGAGDETIPEEALDDLADIRRIEEVPEGAEAFRRIQQDMPPVKAEEPLPPRDRDLPVEQGIASGRGMDDREAAKYDKRYWREKQRQDAEEPSLPYDPEVAAVQRERLSRIGEPPVDIRLSTAEGAPDRLEFPGGRTADITAWNTDGLLRRIEAEEARRAEAGETAVADEVAEPVSFNFDDVSARLTSALNDARRLNVDQREMYREARREKMKKVYAARSAGSGEEGLRAELAALRGEMPRVEYDGVRSDFDDNEITGLFEHIKNADNLAPLESIRARQGLAKLLDGGVPIASEIELLSRIFPRDFVEAASKKRAGRSKFLDAAGNALNLPRAMMATFDLSAPLRQGIFMVGRKEFYKSFAGMFRQFGSERAHQALMNDIRTRPSYPAMEEARLAITNLGDNLSNREEEFMSPWAENIPVFGKGVRASERAYLGFLNKLRADVFDDIYTKATRAGINTGDPDWLRGLGKYINNATGRGALGSLNRAAPILNGLFFSPRLMASRVNMLNPATYITLPKGVREEAVKDLLRFGGIASSVASLAAMAGADVETDPRSSDFAKIRVGDTRYDILGGFGQYLTLGARLLTNETKTAKGEVKTLGENAASPTRLEVLGKFFTNKEAPVASFVTDYLRGADAIGKPFELDDALIQRFVPMFLMDVYEAGGEEGVVGAAKTIPSGFGVGTQTYDPWDVRPPKNIKIGDEKVPLDDKAKENFSKAANEYFDMTRREVQGLPGWEKIPEDGQREVLEQLQREAKKWAKEQLVSGQLDAEMEEDE